VQGTDPSLSMTLTQSDTSVSGTWKSPLSDGTTRSGTVGGIVTTTSFSGAFTYHRTLTDGTNCDGTLTPSLGGCTNCSKLKVSRIAAVF